MNQALNQQDKSAMTKPRFVIVIPVYNHEKMLPKVIEKARPFYDIIVVNDGSSDGTSDVLSSIKDVTVITHETNLGKGAALFSGLQAARNIADYAITIDADGQHNPEEIQALANAVTGDEDVVVIGKRQGMKDEKAPWTSRFGRGFSNFWVFMSSGRLLSDSQSGFRIYPIKKVLDLDIKSKRYQFEVEVLVLLHKIGVKIIEVPISVDYNPAGGRVSHFKPFMDFMRNSLTFSRLVFARILIDPFKFLLKSVSKNAKN